MSHFELTEPDDLLCSIAQALTANPSADGLHISIEPHARELKSKDGSEAYVKALCWNLTSKGQDLSEDDLDLLVVDEDVNEDSIRTELGAKFPGIGCVVDNDILIEEDD